MPGGKGPGSNMPKKLRNAPVSEAASSPKPETESGEEFEPSLERLAACDLAEMNRANAALYCEVYRKVFVAGTSVTELERLVGAGIKLQNAIRGCDAHVGTGGIADLVNALQRFEEAAAVVHGAKPARSRVPATSEGDPPVH